MKHMKFRFGNTNPEGSTPQEQVPNEQVPQGDVNTQEPASKQGEDVHQQQDDKFIPKSRFDEVNTKFKEVQSQLEAIQKEKEQAELEDKKKRGEFENLYQETSQELEKYKSDYESTSQRVEQLEGLIQTMVEVELESVPEELHDLIPDNMTPEQKLAWLSNAKKKGLFGKPNAKADEPLGGSTNQGNGQQPLDVSKMSATQILKSAYGSK